jgi:hypothetical protein
MHESCALRQSQSRCKKLPEEKGESTADQIRKETEPGDFQVRGGRVEPVSLKRAAGDSCSWLLDGPENANTVSPENKLVGMAVLCPATQHW